MPDFTPGPWVIGITVGADGWPVYRIRDMKDPTCMKEKLANADLISAAPEMYEWMDKFCKFCYQENAFVRRDPAICEECGCKNVLVKAGGEGVE